jgi:DNA-binding transcriptional LysR family regulator
MTFKQLEALFWVAQLGGFTAAALKLHTVQSAITKRVQELEAELGVPLFAREDRSPRLTDKGHELVQYAKRLIDLRDEALSQVAGTDSVSRTVKLGFTELTAMTWMPAYISAIRERYAKVTVEPFVDASVNLRDKLLKDEVDLIIAPRAYDDTSLVSEPVGSVRAAWMCKPGLIPRQRSRFDLKDLGRFPILLNSSGAGAIYDSWFRQQGFTAPRTVTSNSVVALVSLAVAGMGLTYLQTPSFSHLVDMGLLVQLNVQPRLPPLEYGAIYRASRSGPFMDSLVRMARESCEFSRLLPLVPPRQIR